MSATVTHCHDFPEWVAVNHPLHPVCLLLFTLVKLPIVRSPPPRNSQGLLCIRIKSRSHSSHVCLFSNSWWPHLAETAKSEHWSVDIWNHNHILNRFYEDTGERGDGREEISSEARPWCVKETMRKKWDSLREKEHRQENWSIRDIMTWLSYLLRCSLYLFITWYELVYLLAVIWRVPC